MVTTEPLITPTKRTLSISLSSFVIFVLLVVIGSMLYVWKPWDSSAGNNARTIDVTGDSTVKAEPDEFVFSPNYQFKDSDKTKALAELTKQSDAVVAKLKELGVSDSSIKTNASGYDSYLYYYDPVNKTNQYSLQLTVTTGTRELAQKVQDYLTTTNPTGAITPATNFSKAKRKELESKARDEATKEARVKAEQSAKNLGFKIGKVKAVNDGTGFGDIMPLYGRSITEDSVNSGAPSPKLGVQPGENDLHYSVSVTYFLK